MNSAPRLGLVVEDQAPTRDWLVALLHEAFPGIAVAAAGSLAAARDWLARTAPLVDEGAGIALIDLALPDGNGATLIRDLVEHQPAFLPVVTTIYDDDAHLFAAIAAGAQGYLLKDRDAAQLIPYLHRIRAGEPPLSPSIARRMMQHFRQPSVLAEPPVALTARETEVLGLLGRGLRVAEAARVLGLTEHTVAGYVKSIYRKLNISSRAEAALEAQQRGLV